MPKNFSSSYRTPITSVSGARHMVAGDRNDHFSAAVPSFIGRLSMAK